MILRKIELNNFRQFHGKQVVKLSTDKIKNVTLIHAENGVGKTAFLNSILWCLFGITTDNFNNEKDILNLHAKKNGHKVYSVLVEFEEEGEIYAAQRGVQLDGSPYFKVFQEVESKLEPIKQDSAIFINSIIPKDMAKYFFFQGEGIGNMTSARGGEEVKNAVRDILGFTVAEFALRDLKKIRDEYRKEAAKADKSGELSKLEDKIEKFNRSIEGNEDRKKELKTEVATYEERLEKLDKEIGESNHENIKLKHNTRKKLENELEKAKKNRSRAYQNRLQIVRDKGHFAFSKELGETSLDFIDDLELEGKIPAPFNESLVKDILNYKTCICGAEIEPGTEAFANIHKLLKDAADPDLMHRVQAARSLSMTLANDFEGARRQFEDNAEAIRGSEEEIEEKSKELQAIDLELQGTDIESVNAAEKRRKDTRDKLGESQKNLGRVEDRLVSDKWELEKATGERDKFEHFTGRVNHLNSLVEAADSIYDVINEELEKSEANVEKVVINKVNQFLQKFVRQDYVAKMNKRFQIFLYDRDDNKVAESDGQSLLLGLTFISSLIELAKERRNVKSNILTSGAVAPFVIDAPFGVLDNKYKGNVAGNIPESVNQVVFLLSSSHWEGSVESQLSSRIGKEYNMVLEVSSGKNDKEEDTITIGSKDYPTVRYSCDVDRTVIEEV